MADDDDLEPGEPLDPNIRKEMRESRKRAESLEVELAQAKREAAFARAGIPDTPLGQMFGKAYDGPTDDPEAIKASFQALGVADPPASKEESDAELEAERRLAQVGSQSQQGGDVRYEDAINSAKNVNELMALIQAAPEGATDSQGRRIGVPRID